MIGPLTIRQYHLFSAAWHGGVLGLALVYGVFGSLLPLALSLCIAMGMVRMVWIAQGWWFSAQGRSNRLSWTLFAVLEWLGSLWLALLAGSFAGWVLLMVAPLVYLAALSYGWRWAATAIALSVASLFAVPSSLDVALIAQVLLAGVFLLSIALGAAAAQQQRQTARQNELAVNQLRKTVHQLQLQDPQTGFASRVLAELYLERAAKLNARNQLGLAVLVYDFSESGPRLQGLKLGQCVREEDLVIRLSLSQVAVALVGVRTDAADRVKARLNQTLVEGGWQARSASLVFDSGETVSTWLDRAQVALKSAA